MRNTDPFEPIKLPDGWQLCRALAWLCLALLLLTPLLQPLEQHFHRFVWQHPDTLVLVVESLSSAQVSLTAGASPAVVIK